jgi:F0F1-type ATP synthase membrane subunit a
MLWEMVEKHRYHLHFVNNENFVYTCSLEMMTVMFENYIRKFPSHLEKKSILMVVLLLLLFYFTNNLCCPWPLELRKAACDECYLYIKAISRMSITPVAADS